MKSNDNQNYKKLTKFRARFYLDNFDLKGIISKEPVTTHERKYPEVIYFYTYVYFF
jgi:hypothetical protein